MGRYATATVVPMEKSRAEIESILRRYGADHFASGWAPDAHVVDFVVRGLRIRFRLPLTRKDDKEFTHVMVRGSIRRRTPDAAAREYEQSIRQRWRALLLVIKAKLEAIECKISTLEQEFLSFIVLPDNTTTYEWFAPIVDRIKLGEMPQLMLPPPAEDAEFEEKK
jgi:hypothetical protein